MSPSIELLRRKKNRVIVGFPKPLTIINLKKFLKVLNYYNNSQTIKQKFTNPLSLS